MHPKIGVLAGLFFLALAAGSVAPMVDSAQAACAANDAINASTATDAAKAMERAGYVQVQVYQKGCDNAWHAHATLNGNRVNVVWNGDGQVITEGD